MSGKYMQVKVADIIKCTPILHHTVASGFKMLLQQADVHLGAFLDLLKHSIWYLIYILIMLVGNDQGMPLGNGIHIKKEAHPLILIQHLLLLPAELTKSTFHLGKLALFH